MVRPHRKISALEGRGKKSFEPKESIKNEEGISTKSLPREPQTVSGKGGGDGG
jgi:hypothetical protein